MKKDIPVLFVIIYILLISVYWFVGKPTTSWAYYYYFIEKLFTAFGFYLLYKHALGPTIKGIALYCVALCFFMLAYFVFTQLFGHNHYVVVGFFILYSILVIVYLRVR